MKQHHWIIIIIAVVLLLGGGYFAYKHFSHTANVTAAGGESAQTITGSNSTGGVQPLTILSAEYFYDGAPDSAHPYGGTAVSKDVTSTLQGLVYNNQLDLNSSSMPLYYASIFGDPAPGYHKQLRVNYQIGAKTTEETVPDDTNLKLNM